MLTTVKNEALWVCLSAFQCLAQMLESMDASGCLEKWCVCLQESKSRAACFSWSSLSEEWRGLWQCGEGEGSSTKAMPFVTQMFREIKQTSHKTAHSSWLCTASAFRYRTLICFQNVMQPICKHTVSQLHVLWEAKMLRICLFHHVTSRQTSNYAQSLMIWLFNLVSELWEEAWYRHPLTLHCIDPTCSYS